MRALQLPSGIERVLCLGAHSDDIEIGCGGTMLQLLDSGRRLDVTWIVFAAHGVREREARDSAQALLAGAKSATASSPRKAPASRSTSRRSSAAWRRISC
jgi:LmbE family N-acetylglucosaminyl deacetylase